MLPTKMAPSSGVLRPYVWAYGMTTGRVDLAPLVIPLPARPKQVLTFSFADGYRVLRSGSGQTDPTPRVTVVGPQSSARPGLSVFGRIDHFTIHFQPSGFNRLFGVPMTDLADAASTTRMASSDPGSRRSNNSLATRRASPSVSKWCEAHLIRLLRDHTRPDPVAIAANRLFASHGMQRVMANDSGLSTRQFERRFLTHVGVPPKLYARIIRFNAVLDHKLRNPTRASEPRRL